MPINRDINIRSDEVQEIMSRPPSWMIRWGISLIFTLILLCIFLSWFIKYPDVISGSATLTTSNPPAKLTVRISGEIDDLLLKDNTLIFKNQPIASIKSSLTVEAKSFLEVEIHKIQEHLKKSSLNEYYSIKSNLVFGEIEVNYLALITAVENYKTLVNDNNVNFNIKNTTKQITNQKALLSLTTRQLGNLQKLMTNADSKFNSDKVLFEKGIISQSDFFDREKTHKMTISDLQNLEKTKIQSSITITDLEKQIHQLNYEFEKQKRIYIQEINSNIATIENALNSWKQSYQITAPIAGKLSYLQAISLHQFVEQGKAIFAIIPENEEYIAHLKIPKTGYGKVKPHQKVMLKIDNFPYYEYGQLEGKVESIALIPNETDYLVKVKFTNGLMSTYKKALKFTPEMTGTAEIITEDLRITDRIFNQFRKVFN